MNSYTQKVPDLHMSNNADTSKMPVATEGAHLMVLMVKEKDYFPAEVLSVKKNADGVYQYYVHWTEFNRRLDEWVGVDRMDLTNISYGQPLKDTKLQSASRASTPDSEVCLGFTYCCIDFFTMLFTIQLVGDCLGVRFCLFVRLII